MGDAHGSQRDPLLILHKYDDTDLVSVSGFLQSLQLAQRTILTLTYLCQNCLKA